MLYVIYNIQYIRRHITYDILYIILHSTCHVLSTSTERKQTQLWAERQLASTSKIQTQCLNNTPASILQHAKTQHVMESCYALVGVKQYISYIYIYIYT